MRASAVMASLQPQLRVNKELFLDVFQKEMGFVQRQIKPCRHYFLTLNFKHGFAAEFKRKWDICWLECSCHFMGLSVILSWIRQVFDLWAAWLAHIEECKGCSCVNRPTGRCSNATSGFWRWPHAQRGQGAVCAEVRWMTLQKKYIWEDRGY